MPRSYSATVEFRTLRGADASLRNAPSHRDAKKNRKTEAGKSPAPRFCTEEGTLVTENADERTRDGTGASAGWCNRESSVKKSSKKKQAMPLAPGNIASRTSAALITPPSSRSSPRLDSWQKSRHGFTVLKLSSRCLVLLHVYRRLAGWLADRRTDSLTG